MTSKQIVSLLTGNRLRLTWVEHIKVDRQVILAKDAPIFIAFCLGGLSVCVVVGLTVAVEAVVKYIF